ncbi:MAG: RHS repeat-associated core domain-containing protein, partial [Phycisphaeraceae bacterium]
MAYDGLGRRIVKAVRHCADLDGTFHDYYNGQQLVETRNGSDIWMKQQVWGLDDVDELVQTTVHIWSAGAEQPYWILQDANYNVLAAIEGGSYGKVAERYEYTPYGERQVFQPSGSGDSGAFAPTLLSQTASDLGAPICEFGHQGLLHDAATGLVYNRARTLLPRFGRFMQRDPLGYVDGMGVYEYVGSGPVNRTDPSGMQSYPPGPEYGWGSPGGTMDDLYHNRQRRTSSPFDLGVALAWHWYWGMGRPFTTGAEGLKTDNGIRWAARAEVLGFHNKICAELKRSGKRSVENAFHVSIKPGPASWWLIKTTNKPSGGFLIASEATAELLVEEDGSCLCRSTHQLTFAWRDKADMHPRIDLDTLFWAASWIGLGHEY